MDDFAPLDAAGPYFNRAHPAGLGDPGLDDALDPRVALAGLHRPGPIADDKVRRLLAEPRRVVPSLIRRPDLWRRHVLGVAPQCALIDPGQNRRDLIVGERSVVLELL